MNRQSKRGAVIGLCLVLVGLLGWIDHATGYELGFFVFYFIPVAYAAWFVGRGAALAVAVASAAAWLAADLFSGHVYSSFLIAAWNTVARGISFSLIAVFLSRIRVELDTEKRLRGELTEALRKVKQLKGLLPICASCKNIRNDRGYWQKIEGYIRDHSDAEFSHGICPECARRLYPEYADGIPEEKVQ